MSDSDLTLTQGALFDDPTPSYLIDANCLMRPYNEYYSPDFKLSELFWSRLFGLIRRGVLGIIDKVRDETYGHASDELDKQLDAVRALVLVTDNDASILNGYRQVLSHIATTPMRYQPKAVRDWTPETVADPWLLATALAFRSTIVTFETKPDPAGRPWKRVKIPAVAEDFGIPCMDLFVFMKEVGGF
ncbi:DUF4411 family protein [uncultured Bifidobacterium sp.]|uniref:DUF4411 family protein n=1 Tax=uncultured Bifidobacterium sp. TaxID=165187 RepID=UPI002591E539|nr:DUF4411 family protein [uncultured Bifidobacterium sp.]